MIKIKILHKPTHEIMTILCMGGLHQARIKAREWIADYFGAGDVDIDYIIKAGV